MKIEDLIAFQLCTAGAAVAFLSSMIVHTPVMWPVMAGGVFLAWKAWRYAKPAPQTFASTYVPSETEEVKEEVSNVVYLFPRDDDRPAS